MYRNLLLVVLAWCFASSSAFAISPKTGFGLGEAALLKVPRAGAQKWRKNRWNRRRNKLKSYSDGGGFSPDEEDMFNFLEANIREMNREIALNWGFILNGGITKMLAGFFALCLPVYANEVAYVGLAVITFLQGCWNLAGTYYEQPKFRFPSFMVGCFQVFLSYRMYYRPFDSLYSLTQLIAGYSVAEGVWQGAVALRNYDCPGWGSLLFSGLMSILGGLFVAKSLPESSLVILGVMMGFHLISGGWASIAVALEGRERANEVVERMVRT